MPDNFVLVTGMFRSGTTLVARMMHAHRKIILASDPYSKIFKAFRNEVAFQVLQQNDFDPDSPLDDYYFYPHKQRFLETIRKTTLDLVVRKIDLSRLREAIAKASKSFSPLIEPFLDDLDGKTYRDLFVTGLDIVIRAYAKKNVHTVGIKQVWVGEFAAHILNAFPKSKIIHIIRDPRAVCASNHATSEKYPLLFLTRQWRKLAAFAWMDQLEFPDRVLILNYEKLITEPKKECERLCNFLELDLDIDMVNPIKYTDGNGKPWKQNSSHFQGMRGFNTESLEKWRQVLTPEQADFIEIICQGEMRLFGYDLTDTAMRILPPSMVLNPFEVNPDEIADWIKPYIPAQKDEYMREIAMELLCSLVLAQKQPVDLEQKKQLFLHENIYNAIYLL